jgi:hypothetical protein
LEKRPKQKKNIELPRRNNNSTKSSSDVTIVDTTPIPTVQEPKVVATPTGWALLNPGATTNEEPTRNGKAGTKNKSSYEQPQSNQRAYKSKRQSQQETLPYTPAVQPMINVQPMMTQSGHMVLMTEDGLCVPATPGMFQYQDWYNNSSANAPPPPPVEQQSPNPYYYTTNYYAPKKPDS